MKNIKALHRLRHYLLLCQLLLVTCVHNLEAQCPAATPPVIQSVTTTESRCAASGTATVLVSGGATPYSYSIIAGPALTTPQSSNVLQSLAPGTYTVQVTDNCNTSVTQSFTVAGTYTVPTLNITTQSPTCPGNSDGSITINATNGRAPLSYSLVSPSPVTAGPQAGNVFTGLPVGTYACQVADSCGNFQTRSVTVSATAGTATFIGGGLRYLACDSFAVTALTDASVYKPPFTFSLTLPNGTVFTHVLAAPPVDGLGHVADSFHIRYHYPPGSNQNIVINITNGCGATSSGIYNLGAIDMYPWPTLASDCGGQYYYTFDDGMDNNGYPSPYHCGTITYTLLSPSGTVLATQINNSTFSGYPAGTGYKVVRQDCCKADTLQFDWAAAPTLKISNLFPATYASCKEGTTSLELICNLNKYGNIIVASGPPSITFADGTALALTYPDTLRNRWLGVTLLDYFTAGTYKLYVTDTCGGKDSATITIDPSSLRHSAFAATLVKGCTGASKLLLNTTTNSSIGVNTGNITVNTGYNKFVTNPSFSDSIVNLSSGTYYASYQYMNLFGGDYLNGMSGLGCDIIADTLVAPAYTQPMFSPSAAIAVCGATRQLALLPDTSSGVSPYAYQVIAGPATTSPQVSAVFPGLPSGTYTFQMVDACANSYTRSMTVDTLAVPHMATTGSTCAGSSATFALPSSPFFSYAWQLPDGSTSTGNSLSISPITASDTGTYKISVTSTIGGCTNTSSKSYTLSYCMALPETLLHFSGQWRNDNILLNWQTADEETMGYYIIERSTDGSRFTPVQQVEAQDSAENVYTATDWNVPQGAVYYRLKMAGKNGGLRYSGIISFNKAHAQSVNVYPRLVTRGTAVTVTYPVTRGSAFIRVIGIDGKLWRTISIPAGSTETGIDTRNLPAGSYIINVNSNGIDVSTQVWKE